MKWIRSIGSTSTGDFPRRVRLDQRDQFFPWHYLIHLGQKLPLARDPWVFGRSGASSDACPGFSPLLWGIPPSTMLPSD
jgi:hypothetical protein